MKKIFVKGKVCIYFTDGKVAIAFYKARTAIYVNPNKIICVIPDADDLENKYNYNY